MKASVCVLFAVACVFVSQAEESLMIHMLTKVMHELEMIEKGLDKSTHLMIKSPTTNDLKDCCVASALECFRTNVWNLTFTDDKLTKSKRIIYKDLKKKIIVNGVNSCSEIQFQKAQCKSCDSYDKVKSHTFVQNFKTLLQKIYASQV